MRRPFTLLPLLLCLLACSCSRRVYVPVERVSHHTDTVRAVSLRVDTVLDRDTVLLTMRGDTVVREVVRWRWRLSHHTDTVCRARVDSVAVPVPVEVVRTVEAARPLRWWQSCLLWLGAFDVAALVAVGVWGFLRFKKTP